MSENEKNLKKEEGKKTLKGLRKRDNKLGFIERREQLRGKDIFEKMRQSKTPTTVEEALEDGWKMGKAVGMSNPPKFTFSKNGKSITIKGEMDGFIERREQLGGKGIFEKMRQSKTGGVIKRKGGGVAKRGFGISK